MSLRIRAHTFSGAAAKNNPSARAVIGILLVTALLLSILCSCGNGIVEDDRPALTVWVYSDENKSEIDRAFSSAFTSIDWRLDVEVVTATELSEKLDSAVASGKGAPDVFMLSPDLLSRYVESDLTLDLSGLGVDPDDNRYYSYTIASGTNSDGALKSVCYEPDPSLLFYRRSLAEYYFGTSDPDIIGEKLSSWEGFSETALQLYELSSGKTRMAMGVEDLMMAYMADNSLVSDGKLSVDEKALDFLEYCKTLASSQLIYDAEQWSPAWVAGISDPQSVFCYFSSGIGMESVLKKACGGTVSGEGSYGDWAAVLGPESFNWGGYWFSVYSGSEMLDEAALFLQYFTCEEAAMRTNCLISGSFSASRVVVDNIKFDSQFSESFLSAQNYYSLLALSADRITMSSQSVYDSVIEPIFAQCYSDYVFGYCSLEQATSVFNKTVQAAYPELVPDE